jgi:hypothetical protein
MFLEIKVRPVRRDPQHLATKACYGDSLTFLFSYYQITLRHIKQVILTYCQVSMETELLHATAFPVMRLGDLSPGTIHPCFIGI